MSANQKLVKMIACKFMVIFLFSFISASQLKFADAVSQLDLLFLEHVNKYLDDFVNSLGQNKNNANGTRVEFREYLLEDQSNEELGHATPQQIITRSGYNYENHYVLAEDGYITQLTRIVNPLAEASKLKQPPVMLLHGGIIDPVSWIWSSAIQHHPEKYPRLAEDGPITSWNRSLAFTLANNGYDVWLIGTRGSNSQNQGHTKYKTKSERPGSENPLSIGQDRLKYWQYSMDELVEYEFPRQIDKVLEVTGAINVTIVTLSLSTQTSLSLFASNKEYAMKTHNYVAIGPIINNIGANNLLSTLHKGLCRLVPDDLGTLVWTEGVTSQYLRDIAITVGKNRNLRYSIIWAASTILSGPSATYQTGLEPAVYGHLFQTTGFKEIKHYCQQVVARRLQKFDHGVKKNMELYGQVKPPAYNISNIHIKNWAVVSGGNDLLATPASVHQVLRTVRPKARHIFGPNLNHLDLVAGVENDFYVNLPVLKFLDKFHLPPLEDVDRTGSSARSAKLNAELEKLVPQEPLTAPNFVTDLKRKGFKSLLSEARSLLRGKLLQ